MGQPSNLMTPSVPSSVPLPIARLAFRPFFLLAALFSLAALGIWLTFWHGDVLLRPQGGLLFWHQHEMLFGFAAAVDLAFLPVVGVVMAWLVIAAKRWRNLIFLPALALLTLANLAMHLGAIDGDLLLIRLGVAIIAGVSRCCGGCTSVMPSSPWGW